MNHASKIIQMKVVNMESSIHIDLNAIESSPFLKGADVLKILFCVSENSSFRQTFSKDENNNNNLLERLDIHYCEWLCLQRFIRTGILPSVHDEVKCLEYTAEKLGGIPYLDSLLCSKTSKEEETQNKHVGSPDDDIAHQYQWGFYDRKTPYSYGNFLTFYNAKDGWNVASVTKDGIWFSKKCI